MSDVLAARAKVCQHRIDAILVDRAQRSVGQPQVDPAVLAFDRSEEHTSELQSRVDLVCRLLLEKKNSKIFLILKSGVNNTSKGSISTSTLQSIKLRKYSSKIITSIHYFSRVRLATKSYTIKELI